MTTRLLLRLPLEDDRSRFVELFTDPAFMVFSGGVCTITEAHDRFDAMLVHATEVPFAKQPVIERSSGVIVGYAGVAPFVFEDERRFEFGYRLCVEARGQGYATEAGLALIETARQVFTGTLLAMIDPKNAPSMKVITKLGFGYWKQATVNGYLDNLYQLELP